MSGGDSLPERVKHAMGGHVRSAMTVEPGGCMVLVVPPAKLDTKSVAYIGTAAHRQSIHEVLPKAVDCLTRRARFEDVCARVRLAPPTGSFWLVYVVYDDSDVEIGAVALSVMLMTKGGDA